MSRAMFARCAAALAMLGVAAACTPDAAVNVLPSHGTMFESYVALGNSITAGYQSSGINDSTQRNSYAAKFAAQVETRFAYPQLAAPGCPPPVVNFLTQSRGNAAFTGATCALRDGESVTATLNNVAVPGALVIDPTTASTASSNVLTMLVLGGTTQVQRAIQADPTFASIWIGNNDVLGAAVRGVLVPNAAVGSPGVTPVADFTQRYDAMLDQLTAGAPRLEGGALFGVVQVQNAPLLFSVGVLLASPAAKTGFDAAAGGAVVIEPNCNTAPSTLVSFLITTQMRSGAHPRILSCGPSTLAPGTAVGEVFILTPAEQTALTAAVDAYNAHIQAKATELGWAYVDVNPELQALRASGAVPPFPTLGSATQTFGTYFSLDGVHPSTAGHVLLTNLMIEAVNAKYGTSLPDVN